MDTCNAIIDLSHHNQNVDFSRLDTNNIIGIIHKATQGSGFSDPAYLQRRDAAKNAGLLWGAYHFGTGADPASQARFFLKVADPGPTDLVVLDFEANQSNPNNSIS